MKKPKMLIVDDNVLMRKIHEAIFISHYEITIAENGKCAFARLKHEHFDVVLTDIDMPIMNGIELAKAIRSLSNSNKEIIIIGVTANKNNDIAPPEMNVLYPKPIEFKVAHRCINALYSKTFKKENMSWLVQKSINA